MTVVAFLDANVLYPATLRSVLMELALAGDIPVAVDRTGARRVDAVPAT